MPHSIRRIVACVDLANLFDIAAHLGTSSGKNAAAMTRFPRNDDCQTSTRLCRQSARCSQALPQSVRAAVNPCRRKCSARRK